MKSLQQVLIDNEDRDCSLKPAPENQTSSLIEIGGELLQLQWPREERQLGAPARKWRELPYRLEKNRFPLVYKHTTRATQHRFRTAPGRCTQQKIYFGIFYMQAVPGDYSIDYDRSQIQTQCNGHNYWLALECRWTPDEG